MAAPDPDVPKVHAAAITQAPTGDLLTVYYGGTSEGAANQALYLSRLATGKQTWSKPEVVVDEPGKADGNPVLWSDGKRVYLFLRRHRGARLGSRPPSGSRPHETAAAHGASPPSSAPSGAGVVGTQPDPHVERRGAAAHLRRGELQLRLLRLQPGPEHVEGVP
ncbi:hypothetical protein GCM10020220_061750 [Nonomuraea rubra]|uniref:exo-alpha-sialidase n=1 Tax=Nonomuraea rubra TaxID=46180 RepID=UPI0031F18700